MHIEALESRIAPAAIATVTGGNLNISFEVGDTTSDIYVSALGGGDYDVLNNYNNVETIVHGVTKGINYTGTPGADYVFFSLGQGFDALPGKLSVKTLGAVNTADSVTLGEGQVRGGVAVDFGSTPNGNYEVAFGGSFRSNGKVSIVAPATDSFLNVVNYSSDVRIGAMKIVNATSFDLGSIRVSGGLTVDSSALFNGVTFFMGESVIGGALNVIGSATGGDSVSIEGTTIAGSVKLALGNGDNNVNLYAPKVGGSVNILTGVDGDNVQVYGGGGGYIGGNLNAALGDGNNSFSLDSFRVGGGLKYTGLGNSSDYVSINTDPYSGGPSSVSIVLGNGGGSVGAYLSGETTKLSIVGGTAADYVNLAADTPSMAVSMKLGAGVDSVDVDWFSLDVLSVKIDGEADGGTVNSLPFPFFIPTTLTSITEI